MPTSEEAKEMYGEELYNKMRKSRYLRGITLCFNDKGESDIPLGDWENAKRDVLGLPVYGWD